MVGLIVGDQTEQQPEAEAGGKGRGRLKPRPAVGEVELSLVKRIVLRLSGAVYVGHRTRPGWSGSLPFYVFRCPAHGLVENYPQGYHGRLDCPLCLHEEAA